MAQNMNNQGSQDQGPMAQPGAGTGSGRRNILIFVAIGLVALVVIALVVVLLLSPSGPSVTINQTKSANSTASYLSPADAQTVLGSSISNYNASDMFNPNATFNFTLMVELVPQLYGNVTSGWVTYALGTDKASNTSIVYMAMQTKDAPGMYNLMGSAVTALVNGTTATAISPGTENGLTYTYGEYTNSTTTFQTVYGWKNNDLTLAIVQENPGYLVNETTLISRVANETS